VAVFYGDTQSEAFNFFRQCSKEFDEIDFTSITHQGDSKLVLFQNEEKTEFLQPFTLENMV